MGQHQNRSGQELSTDSSLGRDFYSEKAEAK